MTQVLIIGGSGRVGVSIAQDILTYTQADVIITGRHPQVGAIAAARLGQRVQFQVLDLAHGEDVQRAIASVDLVIHAAGPFYERDTQVLQSCITQTVNYIDVSDERDFTRLALSHRATAQAAGVTVVINTGVFPGISNSMARQGAESMVSIDSVHLSYLVGGSGGAGTAAMRTTFMGLQRPFDAWIDGQWETVKPYTGREVVEFPRPYGRVHVYWYDMPEQVTLPESLSVQRVITKFGIFPDFYNHLTWMAAHWFPSQLLQNSMTVEFLAQVSHQMTKMSDRFSGTGVAVRCDVYGQKAGNPVHYCSTFTHEGAAAATGCGTGIIAQLVLAGTLNQPGVWSVEQILSTDLFEQAMQQRHLKIQVK